MIPQIANRLIQERSSVGDTVLDPFCGSGTVLTEALILGRNGVGSDINPLAHLIAKVKTTLIEPAELVKSSTRLLQSIEDKFELRRTGEYHARTPYFENIGHWFTKRVIEELAIVKEQVDAFYPPKQESIF